MTDREILKLAIKKAIRNGAWESIKRSGAIEEYEIDALTIGTIAAYRSGLEKTNWYYPLIFDKEFAKAFFGTENYTSYTISEGEFAGDTDVLETWQYHLQQMVLQDNPLLYLSKFLEEKQK